MLVVTVSDNFEKVCYDAWMNLDNNSPRIFLSETEDGFLEKISDTLTRKLNSWLRVCKSPSNVKDSSSTMSSSS